MSNILMIVFWDMGIGGVQRLIRDVIETLQTDYPDWQIVLVLRRKTENNLIPDEFLNKQLNVVYYPHHQNSPIFFGFVFWNIWQFIKIRPNTVLTFLPVMSIIFVFIRKLCPFIKCRIVLNEQSVTSTYLNIRKMQYLRLLVSFFYNRADRIITPTASVKDDLVKTFNIRSNLIKVIPNWTLIKNSLINKKDYDLLFVGRFEVDKNPLLILDLVRALVTKHYGINAVMVGDGSLKTEIYSSISAQKLTGHISIHKFTPNPEKYFARSKILILTSINEGQPFVVLEAARFSTPSIVSAFGGAEEVVISGETGYIAENLDEFVKHVSYLLDNPEKLKRLGENAKSFVSERFGASVLDRFILSVLKG